MTVNNIPWYKSFFTSDYPELYGFHLRTKQTKRQIRFVRKALDLQAGETVLDLCGQGRHSIALAKKGLNVIGLDLNRDYLAWAERAAAEAGVEIETIEADMREIPFSERFDAVISMFSSFGYLESDDEDLRVLEAIRQALKPAGRLLLDLPNQEWIYQADNDNERNPPEAFDHLIQARQGTCGADLRTSASPIEHHLKPLAGELGQLGNPIASLQDNKRPGLRVAAARCLGRGLDHLNNQLARNRIRPKAADRPLCMRRLKQADIVVWQVSTPFLDLISGFH